MDEKSLLKSSLRCKSLSSALSDVRGYAGENTDISLLATILNLLRQSPCPQPDS